MVRLLLFSLFLATASAFDWTQPDLGRDCGPGESGVAPGIKYYYVKETDEILPFFYRGCGGDSNRYDTPNSLSPFRPVDFFVCPGYPISAGDCNTMQLPGTQLKLCPSTAYCQMQRPGYGQCCDSAVAERVAVNRRAPQCTGIGLPAITEAWQYGQRPLLGRNCSHNFCPANSICYQGEFYAYCCEARLSSRSWIQPNLGRACQPGENGEAPGIRYYVDRDVNQAFPFYYLGCGGDSNNRFLARNRAPLLLDYAPCPGYPTPDGEGCGTEGPFIPGRPPKICPANTYCQLGFGGYGHCCNSGAAEREAINRQAPACKAAGRSVVMEERSWGPVHFLGRSCSHNFCPQGSTCHQGEFYAYCCL